METNLLLRTEEMNARYKNPDNDPRGPWKSSGLDVKTYSATYDYPITTPSGRIVNPPGSSCWRLSKQRFEEYVKDNRIWFGTNGNSVHAIKRFLSEVQQGSVSKTIWFREEVGDNQEAKKETLSFNSDDVFTTPKPERLIQRILTLATNSGDWVLDSFLGSGTTAAVAHKMGRRWIGIELGEHCYTHCLPRLKSVVDGTDQGGISKIIHTPDPSQAGNEPTPNPSQEGNKKTPSSEGIKGWVGGGGFKYYYLAPSLLKKDKNDNWIIDERYNANMLAAAMAKNEGFKYCPDENIYWKQGKSTEKDYIFTTTSFITVEYLDKIREEMKPDESLLICCKSFQEACENRYANITIKKIPKMLLGRCEFGKEDYSLNIVNMPEPTPDPSQEGNLNKNPSRKGNKMGISQEGNEHTPYPLSEGEHKSPLLGGDLGVGKSGRAKKPNKDNSTGKNTKQRKLFE
ncbi:MAG: site-specific DNA-methyltransferase [Candidatus Brocadiaceae bacterium]|nr:site-specific DNA-methyltransferase [Candidatus Brocadiaceae bacterium]